MFKLSRHIVAHLGALAAFSLAPSAQAQNNQFLVHDASGFCVDVAGAPGTANGARVQLWACEANGQNPNGTPTDQKWTLQNGFIRNGLTPNKCVDVPGQPGIQAGTKLQIAECELSGRSPSGAQSDQLFDFVDGQFRHRLSALCIGPETTDVRNGVPLVLLRCAKPGAADLEFGFKASVAAPAGQAARAVAAAPTSSKPQYIYPDWPGASQSCVVPMDPDKKRYSVAAGAELMLTDCNTVQGKIFNVSPSRISVAGKPNLCVNISAGARQAVLYLEECKDTEVKSWETKGVNADSGRLRAVGGMWDNQCMAIPDLANDNAKFPMRVNAVPCKGGGRDLKLFVSTD